MLFSGYFLSLGVYNNIITKFLVVENQPHTKLKKMTRIRSNFPVYSWWLLFILPLVVVGCSTNKQTDMAAYTITPPLAGVQVKPEGVTIDPTKAQMVRFAGGTTIDVPANAFVDAQGKVITTPVKLDLETYNSQAAILASGIPMVYKNGNESYHFESAGMFQLTGQSQGQKVGIAANKKLLVNHPSQAKGDDFDMFYFEEEAETASVAKAQIGGKQAPVKKSRKGQWKKLTNKTRDTTTTPKGIDNFKLQFDTKKFPALVGLESIDWQLALSHKNPKDKNHNWVLKEKWASLELTQPKFILGKPRQFISLKNNSGILAYTLDTTHNGEKIILGCNDQVRVFDRNARLITTVSNASIRWGEGYNIYENKYMLVSKNGEPYLYTLGGKQIGHYSGAMLGVQFSFKSNRAVYETLSLDNEDESDYKYIRITDLKGKMIKVLKLEDEGYGDYDGSRIYTHFMLIDDKYIVANSPNGIKVYDLNGKLLKHKPGKFQEISYDKGTEIRAIKLVGTGELIWNFMTGKETHKKTKKAKQNQGYGQDTIMPVFPKRSEKLQRILTYENKQMKLLDWSKQLIKNFAAYDASIMYAGFTNDKKVYTVSKNGAFRIWDINGVLLNNKTWAEGRFDYIREWQQQLRPYNEDLRSFKMYNFKGDFQQYFGKAIVRKLPNDSLVAVHKVNKSLQLSPLLPRPRQVYQLNLHSPKKEFITYIYLDTSTAKLLQQKTTALWQAIATMGGEYRKEVQRKTEEINKRYEQETNLIRTFTVKKFGIYNCDRRFLIQEPVTFAASFDFGQTVEQNNSILFLITNVNGPALIRYYHSMIKEFRVDPKAPNQIVAILPKNKIAVVSKAQMAKVDWEKVKKDKKYTFKMKIIENTPTNIDALTKVLQ